MINVNRRRVLGYAAAAAGVGFMSREVYADPNGWPIGLQLFTVGEDLKKDFEGTLRKVAEIGYRDIECAPEGVGGYGVHQIAEFGKSVGLKLRSMHTSVQDLQSSSDRIFDQAHANGVQYVICVGPWVKDTARIKPLDPSDPLVLKIGKEYAQVLNILNNVSLDDWKWMADLFNQFGEKANAAGLTFGYHNHAFEFKKFDGTMPYDLLIEKTDPRYVSFELDCGWMVSAGLDPVAYLTKYPKRYRLLHIKDLTKDQPPSGLRTTAIGGGTVDWGALFKAAKRTSVTSYFVELEPPFERPQLESAKISYDYLHKLMT